MARIKKRAVVDKSRCAACGSCVKVCPRNAISVHKGIYAAVSNVLCVGCELCAKVCPASVIDIEAMEEVPQNEK